MLLFCAILCYSRLPQVKMGHMTGFGGPNFETYQDERRCVPRPMEIRDDSFVVKLPEIGMDQNISRPMNRVNHDMFPYVSDMFPCFSHGLSHEISPFWLVFGSFTLNPLGLGSVVDFTGRTHRGLQSLQRFHRRDHEGSRWGDTTHIYSLVI
jgi:hypothetical protein